MTEGNGHVTDPGGDAHRALQDAVAAHGPEVLSDTAIMDDVCRERLSAMPREASLIGTAARSDVPAMLQEQISRLGNYGGIHSVATSLADTHGLDRAESLWVVREYARALGLIASGGPRPARRMSGSAEAGDVGAGAAGTEAAGAGAAAAVAAGAGAAGVAGAGVAGAGAAGAGADTVLNRTVERRDGPGDTVLTELPRPASGSGEASPGEGEASPDETVLSEVAGRQPGSGDTMLSETAPGDTALDKAVRHDAPRSADIPGDTVMDRIVSEQPGPGDTVISPVGGGQVPPVEAPPVEAPPTETPPTETPPTETPPTETPPVETPPVETPHSATVLSELAGGAAATAAEGTQAPESEATPDLAEPAGGVSGPGGYDGPGRDDGPDWMGAQSWANGPGDDDGAAVAERPGGYQGGEPRATWEPAAGEAVFGGYQQGPPPAGPASGGPGYPPGPPGGDGYPPPQPLPYAMPKSNRNRNILGIAAAIALVAVYLGIAAAAHLTPFPAKTTAAASTPPPSQTSGTGSSTSTSPTATATPTPTQPSEVLLAKIPADIAGRNNCKDIGTANGATARLQCTGFQGPATGIIYYLYSDANALSKGFDSFLTSAKFNNGNASTKTCATNGKFVNFVVQCEGTFTNQSPAAAGRIAEYQRVNDFDPIIASTDTPQLVMAVLVGTNNDNLLSYWKQFGWIKS